MCAGGATAAPTATLLPASEAQKLPSSQQISDDDYFLKSNEFMAWLPEYKGKLFNGEARGVWVVQFGRDGGGYAS